MQIISEFIDRIKKYPENKNAINDKQADGSWISMSFQEFAQKIYDLSAALKMMGLKKGDKVAIFALPSSSWMIVDFAVMLIGAISVPIYTSITNENFQLIIKSSGARTIFISGREQHNFCKNYTNLFDHMIALDNGSAYEKMKNFKDVLSIGEAGILKDSNILNNDVSSQDIATIVYSSGSSGSPKGVELTQGCILSQVVNAAKFMGANQKEDRYLNFLPLTHILGFLYNIFILFIGANIYYSRDVNQFAKDCQQVHPTILSVVPRILEKLYMTLQKRIKESSFINRIFASWAFNLAHKNMDTFWMKLVRPLADLLLYSKIRNVIGGQVRLVTVGSSRSDPELLKFFNNVGVPVNEGYGLTEACPVTTNHPLDNCIGTVGKPMPGVQVKISPEGEILVKGNILMKGYYKDETATKASIDADGWFHTRDMGKLDDEGRLIFISRFDDRTKTSYGVYIDVVNIENLLNRFPFVNFSTVIADDKPFVTSLIFPNFETIDAMKKQLNLENLPDEKLLNIAFFKKTVDQAIKQLNEKLDKRENIVSYRFIWDRGDLSVLTQTMKMKRKYILEKYAPLIAEMYPLNTMKI